MRSDNSYIKYILEQAKALLAIDSPTGFTHMAVDYLIEEFKRLGYEPVKTVKGGVQICLGGEEKTEKNALLLEAHTDTLGGMVSEITSDGRLKISPLGGMNANNAEGENCRIYTRSGKIYTGTCQLHNPSIHVNGDYDKTVRSFGDSMEIVVDEVVGTQKETEALGIMAGDIVAFDPRCVLTESGYLKSRFLDDKLSVAILLGIAKYAKEEKKTFGRKVMEFITVYEEVGHGGSASIPSEVKDILAVDMGCVGDGLSCKETQVSICAKDSRGPYDYFFVSELIAVAQKAQIDFAVDVYPHYGSDADTALIAGHDVRHALVGSGIFASHGYERTHVEGIKNTFALLCAYLFGGNK